MNQKKAILVIGAGDATGGAIARRFAREGFVACVTRRSEEKLQPLVKPRFARTGPKHGKRTLAEGYSRCPSGHRRRD